MAKLPPVLALTLAAGAAHADTTEVLTPGRPQPSDGRARPRRAGRGAARVREADEHGAPIR